MKKRLIWIVIGVVLLCVAAAGLLCLKGKGVLAQKIAELKAQGLPTTFAELEAKYKLPEGTPNAADIYMKAFAAYKPLPEEKQKLLPVLGCQSEPNANEPYPPEQMAAAAEFVELNKEMFLFVSQGRQVEDCYYPMDYSMKSPLNGERLQGIKRVCQSLKIAGIYYSQTQQPQKALDAVVDQLRLGQSMSRCPILINHLVRIALLSLGISGTQEFVNRTTPDESELRLLQEYLQQIGKSTNIAPALSGEICFCLESKSVVGQKPAGVLSADDKAGLYVTVLVPQNSTVLIEAYQRMIEIDKLPIQEQLLKVREVVKEADHSGFLVMQPQIVLPAIEKVYEIHLRVRANIDCAITALAVERYRLKEKKLPETLDVLTPVYLPQIYLDPFDGKPLRYKRTEPGYMIYTVGGDGVDDGGRAQDPNDRGKTFDWVFRVYR